MFSGGTPSCYSVNRIGKASDARRFTFSGFIGQRKRHGGPLRARVPAPAPVEPAAQIGP